MTNNDRTPLITVGLPVYNGEKFVGAAIESILAQTFIDFELVISDNGSTDTTSEICAHYAERDDRVRFYRSDVNRGATWNFNRVVELARGRYFKWAAHDDVIAPQFLDRCLAVLQTDQSVRVAYTKVVFIDAHGSTLNEYEVKLRTDSHDPVERFRELLLQWHLCFEIFGLLYTEDIRRCGMLGSYSHGDGVLLERLALLGPFEEVPERLFSSRRHEAQSMAVFGVFDQGHNDYRRYAQWFDTQRTARFVFPTWRMLVEHLRVIWCSPLNVRERALCLAWVGRWAIRQRGPLVVELALAARDIVADLRPEGSRVGPNR